eukprot:Em0003g969a
MSGKFEFVGNVPYDLFCFICNKPTKDPQRTRCTCSKLYCLKCIQHKRQTSGKCPTCTQDLVAFPDGTSAWRLRRVMVKCSNNGAGCLWVVNGQHSKITSIRAQRSKSTALTPRDANHSSKVLTINENLNWYKISGESPAPQEYGWTKFATFSELYLNVAKQCEYLNDDTLYFRVCSQLLEENMTSYDESKSHITHSQLPFCTNVINFPALPGYLEGTDSSPVLGAGEDSVGLSFQLATLDYSGKLNPWVVVEIYCLTPMDPSLILDWSRGAR